MRRLAALLVVLAACPHDRPPPHAVDPGDVALPPVLDAGIDAAVARVAPDPALVEELGALGARRKDELTAPAVAPPANITVDNSPDRVARGKYLYTVVADCDSCHGERDYSRLYAPVTASGKEVQ